MTSPPVPPPRRRYAEPRRPPGPRTRDVSALVQHAGPVIVGFGVGMVWAIWTPLPLITAPIVAFAVWLGTRLVMGGVGAVTSRYVGLRGTSTPPRLEYSAAQAMVAQGRYREAVDAYEVAAAESDGDPEPYLAIARLLRDQLGDFAGSAAWFRRARRDAHLHTGLELLVAQELAELYSSKMGEPRRAIPELARVVRLLPEGPQAEAVSRRLAELRSQLGPE